MKKALLKRFVSILLFLVAAITSTSVFAYGVSYDYNGMIITGAERSDEEELTPELLVDDVQYFRGNIDDIHDILGGSTGNDEEWIGIYNVDDTKYYSQQIKLKKVNFVFPWREEAPCKFYTIGYNGPGTELTVVRDIYHHSDTYSKEVQDFKFEIEMLFDVEKISVIGCTAIIDARMIDRSGGLRQRDFFVDYGILHINDFDEARCKLHVDDCGIAFINGNYHLDKITGNGLLFDELEGTILDSKRFVLPFDFTLPEGYTLTIEERKSFVVPRDQFYEDRDVVFVNEGTIINNGNFTVYGKFINNGTVICKEHNFDENGFCICGDYEPAALNSEGKYAISNAGNLFWLSQQINSGEISKFNAVLTNDIKIPEGKEWKAIELRDGMDNSSVFDGKGYTIDLGKQSCGLFSKFNYSTAKNLILKGNITANTDAYTAAVSASSYRTTFENIISYVSVSNTGTGNIGGLSGYFGGGYDVPNGHYSIIKNCAVYADLSGKQNVGGLIGCIWEGHQQCKVMNSAFSGNLNGSIIGGIAGSNLNSSAVKSTFADCYYSCNNNSDVSHVGVDKNGQLIISRVSATTSDQFASGEVTWLLNVSSSGGGPWKQTLGTDAYPNHTGMRVYYVNSEYTNEKDDGTNSYASVQDENTSMVPIATMVEEHPELLFTGILAVIVLVIGAAFVVRAVRLKKKTK